MPVTWRAPGRINLIGEHTDYNGGFALPFAIEQACTATVQVIVEPVLRITSAQRPDPVEVPIGDLDAARGGWAGYVAGVVWSLRRSGAAVSGLLVDVDSTVPSGAGLSSSAALVCSVATAVDELLGLQLSASELLAVTRSAENEFVGAPTGGMDQLAALRCTAGNALFCDMATLATETVPLPIEAVGLAILAVDTRSEHSHADGDYRRRRTGCERAAEQLGLGSLRDLDAADLEPALGRLPEQELRRYVRHVVTENARVLRTTELLRAGRIAEVGPLLTASHASLRDDYRVSTEALDLAAETLLASGALGARMTGGGFGGTVIGLVAASRVGSAAAAVTEAYARRHLPPPAIFTAQPSSGARRVG